MSHDPSALDVLGSYRGVCAFCDSDDARHRVGDAIVGRVAAGEDVEVVGADYGLGEDVTRWFVDHWRVSA